MPLPTVMEMAPAPPPVAVPEPTLSDPELPPLDVPDENDIVPDPPAAPALADLMVRAPLDEAVPPPLDMNMTPPVLTVPSSMGNHLATNPTRAAAHCDRNAASSAASG